MLKSQNCDFSLTLFDIKWPTQQKKWTVEEKKVLRELKEVNQSKNRINWKNVSVTLNHILGTKKTSKQCRQHFFNYLQFGEGIQASFKWSQEERELFRNLYMKHGSSWSLISQSFTNKSENAVKNMFNNTIRRTAKDLHEYEVRVLKKYKKGITVQLLTTLFDLSNEVRKKLIAEGLTANEDSCIFKFRNTFLRYCFSAEKPEKQKIEDLIFLIKEISSKFKCFSVFKVKHRNQFKLTTKCLTAIYQLDEICTQNLLQLSKSSDVECCPSPSNQTEDIVPSNEKIEKDYFNMEFFQVPEFDESLKRKQNSVYFDALGALSISDQSHLFYF